MPPTPMPSGSAPTALRGLSDLLITSPLRNRWVSPTGRYSGLSSLPQHCRCSGGRGEAAPKHSDEISVSKAEKFGRRQRHRTPFDQHRRRKIAELNSLDKAKYAQAAPKQQTNSYKKDAALSFRVRSTNEPSKPQSLPEAFAKDYSNRATRQQSFRASGHGLG